MAQITAEEARWLRQLIGATQKKAPEVVRRKLLSLGLVAQKPNGVEITEEGRLALRRASAVTP
ncbi:MAG TPA: hypothetical protein VLN59_17235 [Burkholderiales bacterium]|nr:hypothetical protein [Burkholderiales bacterium]